MSEASLTDYIGIWIKENLMTDEFNFILAEELCHHRQAYYKYYTISVFGNEHIRWFGGMLYNNILDIDAHLYLFERGFDLTPIQNLDYVEAIYSIKTFTQEQRLYSQQVPFMLFPQYLLWWFDLVYLKSSFMDKWETEIYNWFSNILPPETIALWDDLREFVVNHPVRLRRRAQSRLVETLMTRICRELVRIMPVFTEMETTGLNVNLMCTELVPRERTPNIKGWGLGGNDGD